MSLRLFPVLLMVAGFLVGCSSPTYQSPLDKRAQQINLVQSLTFEQEDQLEPITTLRCHKVNKFSLDANITNCKRSLKMWGARVGASVVVLDEMVSGERMPLSGFGNKKHTCKNCVRITATAFGPITPGPKSTEEAINNLVEEIRE